MSLREGGKEFLEEGGRGLEWLKNFDVFPKTVDDAKEVSVSGGSVLLLYRTEKLRGMARLQKKSLLSTMP